MLGVAMAARISVRIEGESFVISVPDADARRLRAFATHAGLTVSEYVRGRQTLKKYRRDADRAGVAVPVWLRIVALERCGATRLRQALGAAVRACAAAGPPDEGQ